MVGISYMKAALELEDAEQAYYSQWWRWGYDDQPPLYTWLQIIFNSIFGVSKLSFALLRGLIFAGTLVMVYRFALAFLKDGSKAVLVVLSLSLIPVFIDLTFRRLSHTSLLILVVMATYLIIQRIRYRRTVLNYMLLGLLIGMGVLTKYNYGLFLGGLFLLLFVDTAFRKTVFNSRILVTLILVVLLVLPHFYWLVHHGYLSEINNSIAIKAGGATVNKPLVIGPLLAFFVALIKLVSPLLVVVLILKVWGRISLKLPFKGNWLLKLWVSQSLVLMLVFIFFKVQIIETRWLLPLFIPFLVLLFGMITFKNMEKWISFGFYTFLAILSVQTLRTPVEKIFKIPSSVHYGFHEISNILQQDFGKEDWVLPNVTYGGNIRFLNPDREVFSTDDFSLPKEKIDPLQSIFLVRQNHLPRKCTKVDSVQNFGKDKENLYLVRF